MARRIDSNRYSAAVTTHLYGRRMYEPVVGGGKRFFPEGVRLDLRLVEERRFGNGVIALRYVER